jgi:serine/threonine protein kinase
VKPANIFVMGDGALRLGDFGIADFIEGGHRGHTLEYASPELVQGQARTPADDVWAAGVTLYELLMGELPFGNCDEQLEEELCARICTGIVVPPDQSRPFLPRQLRRVFERIFNPDLAAREITAPTALHDALADVPLRVEWVRTSGEHELEKWEGHEIDGEGRRTGTVYEAGIESRPRLGHADAYVKRGEGSTAPRKLRGLSLEPGSEAQVRQRLYTAMRRISAMSDPRC